jgi:hypothetical protein
MLSKCARGNDLLLFSLPIPFPIIFTAFTVIFPYPPRFRFTLLHLHDNSFRLFSSRPEGQHANDVCSTRNNDPFPDGLVPDHDGCRSALSEQYSRPLRLPERRSFSLCRDRSRHHRLRRFSPRRHGIPLSFFHRPSSDIVDVAFRGGVVAPRTDRSGSAVRTFRLGSPGVASPRYPSSRRFCVDPDAGDRQGCADLSPRGAQTLSPSSRLLFHPGEYLCRISAAGRNALSSGSFPPKRHPRQGDELYPPLRNPPRNGSICPPCFAESTFSQPQHADLPLDSLRLRRLPRGL